ncbi:MAG TPA: transposase [Thermoplasmata archaeon]|nr:transposase [Thermoplasmata archaeon]
MYQPTKYRLYPFPNQERELLRQFEELRLLWNHALEQRQEAWRKEKRSVSYVGQCRDLARWRAYDKDGIGRVYGHVAQETLARLDDSFKHFFRRMKEGGKPGFPHFKRAVTSMCYPDSNGSATVVPGRNGTWRLRLSKVGELPVKVHREPPEGRVKTCTVQREGDRWFAVPTYEVADPAPPFNSPPTSAVGVDLGLSHLAVLSTGEAVESPEFLGKSEQRLARAQRVVSRRKKGSHNREKAKLRVVRCHAKVRDQRRDFAHKVTTGWAQRHDLIAFEDLSVTSMLGNGHLSKSISDAGWGMLRQMAAYKEARCSGRYVEVPAKGTTQTCSKCGHLADPPLTLKDRTYSCPCGLRLDRDLNAAKNILARAIAQVPGGTGEYTPVEIGPPAHRKGRRVRSLKQEPPLASAVAR